MSILKREVLYDIHAGTVRFWDWASTLTTLGQMAEPFLPNDRHIANAPYDEFDPADMMARIDELRASPVDKQLLTLSGGIHQLHGGPLLPRGDSR